MRGFSKVFGFTLKQQFKQKSFLSLTISLTLLLFLAPALILPLVEKNSGKKQEEPAVPARMLEKVYMAAETEDAESWSLWEQIPVEGFENVKLTMCGSREEAKKKAAESRTALALILTYEEQSYEAKLLLPTETEVSRKEADAYGMGFTSLLQAVNLVRMGLTPDMLGILTEIPEQKLEAPTAGGGDELYEDMRMIFTMILPYLNIMVMYFMVLMFGQNVGNSVILEKTSKLMDTFLVSVKPRAMIFGKVLAIWCCAVSQILLWAGGLIAGVKLGTFLVYQINPDSHMGFLIVLELLKEASGMFTLSGLLAGLLMLFMGLMLYCGLSGIGGAMASKPEELANTNAIFTMTLVISFLATLYSGFLSGEIVRGMSWVDLVPFTSVLITPARLLLGYLSPMQGLLSCGIVFVFTVFAVWAAGEIYNMLSLYKGNVPKPAELLKMFRGGKKSAK